MPIDPASLDPTIPAYEVLIEMAFYEPEQVYRGSVIQTHAPPGPHLKPLNQAARDAFEAWYNDEAIAIDENGRKLPGVKVKHHEKYRPAPYIPGERQSAVVVSGPPVDLPGALSLAESMTGPRTPTDQRPGPLRSTTTELEKAFAAADKLGSQGEISVLHAAPEPTPKERKPS